MPHDDTVQPHAEFDCRVLALIRATEQLWHVPEGGIIEQNRAQPVVAFRQLAMLVARDAGYSLGRVAYVFKRDNRTTASNIAKARYQVEKVAWWANAKADLIDAWHEALGE